MSLAGGHWQLKLQLQIALTVFFSASYFTLQRISVFPQHEFWLSPIDRTIEFDPRWVWVYQSAYVLMGLVPWLADSTDDLQRYARGFLYLSCAGFVCFFFWPVAAPRPVDVPPHAMYRFLLRYDDATNAFPSLHVGLTTYTVLFGIRASRGRAPAGARMTLIGTGVAWSAAIGYATIATKQHYAVDALAGALLAWSCHRRAWTHAPVRQRRVNHAEASSVRLDFRRDPLPVLEPAAGQASAGRITRPNGNRG